MSIKPFIKIYKLLLQNDHLIQNCYGNLIVDKSLSYESKAEYGIRLDRLASDNAHSLHVLNQSVRDLPEPLCSKIQNAEVLVHTDLHNQIVNNMHKESVQRASKSNQSYSYKDIVPKIVSEQTLLNYAKRRGHAYAKRARKDLEPVAKDYIKDAVAVMHDYYHLPSNKPISKSMTKDIKKHHLGSSSSQVDRLRRNKAFIKLYNDTTHEHRHVNEKISSNR